MNLTRRNFLLFVGGADDRRRLQDLVAAFNQLKASGSDLKLVLSGDIMKGPNQIPSPIVRKALLHSSYLDDIYFVGFTEDKTRDWLYANTLAFIFPSVYEGFGLPVLEAMALGTQVICYRNRAVEELVGQLPMYADDVYSIVSAVNLVQKISKSEQASRRTAGINKAKEYTWEKTAAQILSIVDGSS